MQSLRGSDIARLCLILVALGLGCRPGFESGLTAANLPASLLKSIAAREYEASFQDQKIQAPNRAQNLRTYFEPTGIRVQDRTAQGSPALISFELRTVGGGESSRHVPPGEVRFDGARVEIERGSLVEWYDNRPEGLEQGFTLAERPEGSGELWLEIQLSGARASEREGGVEL